MSKKECSESGTKRKLESTIKDQLKHICPNPRCPQHYIDSSVTDFQFSKRLSETTFSTRFLQI
jgi:hypothetical protein